MTWLLLLLLLVVVVASSAVVLRSRVQRGFVVCLLAVRRKMGSSRGARCPFFSLSRVAGSRQNKNAQKPLKKSAMRQRLA
jgi:hypothetical protein